MAAAIDTAHGSSLQVNPYALSQPTPPGIQILPPGIAFDFSMGLHSWTFMLQGFVSFTSDIGGQMLLDELIEPGGPASVKTLLEADPTLGGLIDSVRVEDSSPAREVNPTGGNPMLLVEWRAVILASGTGS